jgi:hypothetical protein
MDVIARNLNDAFHYASEGLIGKWMRWVVLIIASVIFPLIMGYSLRIMKGITPAPEPGDYGGLFIDGIKMMIISIIYMLIPCIIGIIIFSLSGGLGTLTLLGMNVTNPGAYGGILSGTLGISLLVFILVIFFFSLFEIIGMIRFARSGNMGSAFAFNEIVQTISKIGWGPYVISIIVIEILLLLIYCVLSFIPLIGWLLNLIMIPYLTIAGARFYSNLYDLQN